MEKCFMSREKLFVKILLEKKELNIVTASENLREKLHYFDTFEHPCRGISLINVEKWILTFFLMTLLFIVLSVDFLEEVRLIKPCCEKTYYLHINGTKKQNNYYKSIHAVLSALHMIAMARSFNPC